MAATNDWLCLLFVRRPSYVPDGAVGNLATRCRSVSQQHIILSRGIVHGIRMD